MACSQTQTLLHGYLDGELDAVRSAEFERHLEICSQCAAQLAAQENLRTSLKSAQLYEKTPAGLAQKIARQLDAAAEIPESRRTKFRPAGWLQWWKMATALVTAAIIGSVAYFGVTKLVTARSGPQNVIVAEAIDAHIRSLQPGHLTDVLSTDQHTVKPWFDGKLDYIPPVKDEAENGYPLMGGRLDALGGRTVAALVYGRRKHLISVFAWPGGDNEAELRRNGSHNGYQWVYWKKGALEFCAISDVSEADLRELVELLQ